jgi:large subunit ribosomal protein L29
VTDITEIREMDDDELYLRLVESKQEMFNLRFQHVTGQLDNYSRLGDLKRDIARLRTILREREIEAAERPEGESPPVRQEEPDADDSRRGRRARVAASRKADAKSSDSDDESTTPEENGG